MQDNQFFPLTFRERTENLPIRIMEALERRLRDEVVTNTYLNLLKRKDFFKVNPGMITSICEELNRFDADAVEEDIRDPYVVFLYNADTQAIYMRRMGQRWAGHGRMAQAAA